MKSIAVSVLALALSAAAGSAVAAPQDYGSRSDSRYDSRYDNDYDPYDYDRYDVVRPRYDIAQVIRVQPRFAEGYARQECWNERTRGYDSGYYRDSNGRLYRGDSTTDGMLLGALIGGALGNQVGDGDGRRAATVAGAVLGGALGRDIDRDHDGYSDDGYAYGEFRDQSGIVRRCRTVGAGGYGYDNRSLRGGYEVTYRYAGRTYHAITATRPGRTIRVAVDVRPIDRPVTRR